MPRTKPNFCQFCKQDLIRDCSPGPGRPCFFTSIGKLVDMAGQVGLCAQDMIDLLNGGLTLAELLGAIASATALASSATSSTSAC
jgi:hypothetical protein